MFLSPVKEKLSGPYPELFSLLEKADGVLCNKMLDESYPISHEHPVFRCDTFDEAVSEIGRASCRERVSLCV